MVVLYVCAFLRRKTFENEMHISRLYTQLEGQRVLYAEEEQKFKNITNDLQKQIDEKIREVVADKNYEDNKTSLEEEKASNKEEIKIEEQEINDNNIEDLEIITVGDITGERQSSTIQEAGNKLENQGEPIVENSASLKDFEKPDKMIDTE